MPAGAQTEEYHRMPSGDILQRVGISLKIVLYACVCSKGWKVSAGHELQMIERTANRSTSVRLRDSQSTGRWVQR
jgi:hypothetical protein